jgi:hypothetical protein
MHLPYFIYELVPNDTAPLGFVFQKVPVDLPNVKIIVAPPTARIEFNDDPVFHLKIRWGMDQGHVLFFMASATSTVLDSERDH